MNNIKISILMGIFNCEHTLAEAIVSIQKQTYTDWELILCDDGSSDHTYEVACKFVESDRRIILIRNNENMGLNYTLNRCLSIAKGEYIARMDGDDISMPTRLEKELNVLEAEQDIDIVSTDMACFDDSGVWGRIQHPEYPDSKYFMKEIPFCHAACLVRKSAYEAVGGYTESKWLLRVEDYNLWEKMYAVGYKGKNIHEVLYYMRDDREAYKRRKFRYRINESYARFLAVKELRLPVYYLVYSIRPIVTGLLPMPLYNYIHKKRLKFKG